MALVTISSVITSWQYLGGYFLTYPTLIYLTYLTLPKSKLCKYFRPTENLPCKNVSLKILLKSKQFSVTNVIMQFKLTKMLDYYETEKLTPDCAGDWDDKNFHGLLAEDSVD